MQLEPAEFLKILDLMGIEFSYLSEEDVAVERSWWMQFVLNPSPLIFLAKLGYLNQFIESSDDFYISQSVADKIRAKLAPASQTVQSLINSGNLQVRASNLTTLANSLNQRLGKGESEAIALGIELDADYVLLDDSTARREVRRLGLKIKGTLAIIKKLSKDGKIRIENLDNLYHRLPEIEFRVKRSLFDQIFSEDWARQVNTHSAG